MSSRPPDPARWQAVKDALNELLALDDAPRQARLDALRAADPTLADEVASLLRHSGEPELPSPRLAPLLAPAPEERLGPWRIGRIVGEGGMGIVFEVRRSDGAYEQRAALKLLTSTWGRPGLKERFAEERRILASLEHPGIARLLDGGESARGQPYLVMEFVDGAPITRHVRDAKAPLRRRVELLVQALDIVQFAHERLIVHRDIKPSNVVVTASGDVKLLDFGIAKAIAPDTAPAGDATRIFTPGYASPEQVRGERATAAADVYAMGVLLYELLTGTHPYPASSENAPMLLEAVLSTDPERPSRRLARVDPAAPRIPAELDAVVAKAMARDARDRYQTARAFAADLQAFLDHQPLSVRSPSPLYVAGKFVRRHRLGTALGALSLATVLGATAVALAQAHRAERARLEAERRFTEVRRLANDIIFSYQEALEPLGGQALDVRLRLLRDGIGYLDALTGTGTASDALLREAAAAYQRIGDLLGNLTEANLGHSEEALASYGKAKSLRASLFARRPTAEDGVGLATLEHAIGRAHLTQGRIAQAQQSFAAAERLMDQHGGEPMRQQRLMLRLDVLSAQSCAAFGYQGDSRPALQGMEQLAPEFARLLEERRGAPQIEASLSFLLAKGALHGCTGQVALATQAFERADTMTRELVDMRPYDARALHRRAMILLELGYWRAVGGDLDSGLATMEQARDLAESLFESHRRDAKLRLDLATIYSKLGGLQLRRNKLAEAQAGARRAEVVLQSLLVEDPQNQTFHTLLGAAYNRQAQVAFARGRNAEALRLTNLALAELRAVGTRHTAQKAYVAAVLYYRATVERAAGDAEAAMRSARESAAVAREAARENPAAVEARLTLAKSLMTVVELGPPVQARPEAAEALATLRELQEKGGLPPAEKALLARAAAALAPPRR